jgi:hypothetical protein
MTIEVSNWENMHIQYSNTTEYRQLLRDLFSMDKQNYPVHSLDPDIDVESKDELEYDEEAAKVFMDNVYNNTKNISLFRDIYLRGASFMLSQDMNIGIAIMFSYDYLNYFIPCYIDFCKHPDNFNKQNASYQNLYQKLYY